MGPGKTPMTAGPASILISYTFVGLIVFAVMAALGEMAAWLPFGEGFAGYATRFCDPALGFALGYVSIMMHHTNMMGPDILLDILVQVHHRHAKSA